MEHANQNQPGTRVQQRRYFTDRYPTGTIAEDPESGKHEVWVGNEHRVYVAWDDPASLSPDRVPTGTSWPGDGWYKLTDLSLRGPGRPEVGPAVNTRLSPELLDMIDEEARLSSVSRAEMIRRLLTDAVTSRRANPHPPGFLS